MTPVLQLVICGSLELTSAAPSDKWWQHEKWSSKPRGQVHYYYNMIIAQLMLDMIIIIIISPNLLQLQLNMIIISEPLNQFMQLALHSYWLILWLLVNASEEDITKLWMNLEARSLCSMRFVDLLIGVRVGPVLLAHVVTMETMIRFPVGHLPCDHDSALVRQRSTDTPPDCQQCTG